MDNYLEDSFLPTAQSEAGCTWLPKGSHFGRTDGKWWTLCITWGSTCSTWGRMWHVWRAGAWFKILTQLSSQIQVMTTHSDMQGRQRMLIIYYLSTLQLIFHMAGGKAGQEIFACSQLWYHRWCNMEKFLYNQALQNFFKDISFPSLAKVWQTWGPSPKLIFAAPL